MDRPSRKTKVVSYCEAKDIEDDENEDFAAVKPPSKKAREEYKKASIKSSSQESNSQSTVSQKSRRPLDERLRERDLEAAITLSLLNNLNEAQDQTPISKGVKVVKVEFPADENTDPASLCRSNCSVDGAALGLDEISSENETLSKQRKSVAKAAKDQRKELRDEDEDYEPKLTPESESDKDFSEPAESEDEEFTVKNVSKTKKKGKKVKETKTEKTKPPPASKRKPASKPPKSQAAAAVTPVRSPPTGKAAPKSPVVSSTVPTSKPAISVSPAGGRIPKWNPPGVIGKSPHSSESPTIRSPGQGLRLGLSRLVRVKPLHPSVASH